MKNKYYFSDMDEERCYTMKSILDWMKDEGMEILTIYPAKMMTGDSFFYCSVHGECGEVGEGCGRLCKEYNPRNGKNGRCRHSRNCYEALNDQPIIITTKTKRDEN